jgi:hypothetical protein
VIVENSIFACKCSGRLACRKEKLRFFMQELLGAYMQKCKSEDFACRWFESVCMRKRKSVILHARDRERLHVKIGK